MQRERERRCCCRSHVLGCPSFIVQHIARPYVTGLPHRTASHDITKHARTTSGSVRESVGWCVMCPEMDVTIAWYWETISVQRTERKAGGRKQGIFAVQGMSFIAPLLNLSRTPSVCSTFCSSVLPPSPGFFQLHQ